MSIPLAKPSPARLSEALHLLREMEDRAVFTNFGPINRQFENDATQHFFGGLGTCMTVCNATIGLLLAIRQAIETRSSSRRRYALMPSFTFAAAAQAAIWNGLTPLFCDINPLNWCASENSEQALLEQYAEEIAVVVPYATLGFDIDLGRYEEIQRRYGIPTVVDAAASLGTISEDGSGFGTGFSGAVVFSMHATKSFATSEGGLIYSADRDLIGTLRRMSNFGFGEARNAASIGLNGKMSEVEALLAKLCLGTFGSVVGRRSELVQLYRDSLPKLTFQTTRGLLQVHQFATFLIPSAMKEFRHVICGEMRRLGVESATYFSPHVAEQDYFLRQGQATHLPITADISSRVLTLPLYNTMKPEHIAQVAVAVQSGLNLVEDIRHSRTSCLSSESVLHRSSAVSAASSWAP